jgi:signal transduction histidine kinase
LTPHEVIGNVVTPLKDSSNGFLIAARTQVDLEFVELIEVFNQMLSRLEQSFKQASRFSADAAHELKTRLSNFKGREN